MDWRADWLGNQGAGAACAEPRSPVPTAAVAVALRLQWSAPQPLLSQGRGASRAVLWVPRPYLAVWLEWNLLGSALVLCSHPSGDPSLSCW